MRLIGDVDPVTNRANFGAYEQLYIGVRERNI